MFPNQNIPPPYDHQAETAEYWVNHPLMFCTSDPGTGKTRAIVDGFNASRQFKKRMIVFAPLSILEVSWLADIQQFAPHLTAAVARGSKRLTILQQDVDIVIVNHDSVKWLLAQLDKYPDLFKDFTHLAVDESTAFKNSTSQRSKAMAKFRFSVPFTHVTMMTGTPDSNGVCDLWHQAYLLDKGKRLGNKFFHFRNIMCYAQQTGPKPEMRKFIDHDDAGDKCATMLEDITIRHELEQCMDMPEQVIHDQILEVPKKVWTAYNELMRHGYLEMGEEVVNPINAGAKVRKLLQLLSGAVYDEDGKAVFIHKERYQYIIDLILERPHQSLVAFNWKHERDALVELAEKANIVYGVIDGNASAHERKRIVEEYQAGKIKVIFAHPQSAGHGLTLTKGLTTIWASPVYNAEHYVQFNRRQYRAGQTLRTEIIRIAYAGTHELEVYRQLDSKVASMDDLLELFRDLTHLNAA